MKKFSDIYLATFLLMLIISIPSIYLEVGEAFRFPVGIMATLLKETHHLETAISLVSGKTYRDILNVEFYYPYPSLFLAIHSLISSINVEQLITVPYVGIISTLFLVLMYKKVLIFMNTKTNEVNLLLLGVFIIYYLAWNIIFLVIGRAVLGRAFLLMSLYILLRLLIDYGDNRRNLLLLVIFTISLNLTHYTNTLIYISLVLPSIFLFRNKKISILLLLVSSLASLFYNGYILLTLTSVSNIVSLKLSNLSVYDLLLAYLGGGKDTSNAQGITLLEFPTLLKSYINRALTLFALIGTVIAIFKANQEERLFLIYLLTMTFMSIVPSSIYMFLMNIPVLSIGLLPLFLPLMLYASLNFCCTNIKITYITKIVIVILILYIATITIFNTIFLESNASHIFVLSNVASLSNFFSYFSQRYTILADQSIDMALHFLCYNYTVNVTCFNLESLRNVNISLSICEKCLVIIVPSYRFFWVDVFGPYYSNHEIINTLNNVVSSVIFNNNILLIYYIT